jgi:hypothetical protein
MSSSILELDTKCIHRRDGFVSAFASRVTFPSQPATTTMFDLKTVAKQTYSKGKQNDHMTQRPRCGHHLQSKVLRFGLCGRKDLIQQPAPPPSPHVLVESENRSLYKHGWFSLFPILFFSKATCVATPTKELPF